MTARTWRQLALPVTVLGAAYGIVPLVPALPESLAGLRTYGAAMLLATAAAVSLAFGRGRVLLAAAVLAIAYGVYLALLREPAAGPPARAGFVALTVLVPLNFATLAALRERGLLNVHGLQRAAVLLAQLALVSWLSGERSLIERAYAPLFGSGLLPASPVPDLGLAAIALGGAVCGAMWLRTRSPVDLALAGALAAFAAAANALHVPHAFAVYAGAGGLILTIGVLQDSFRMAFRDGLTGLPSRRALEERLAALGRRYTIAMVDVDHFKSFNDTYGHDVGDQVLKVVAARLASVAGGGTAFRYGGEEFTVLFPSRSVAEAVPHLEALREAIAGYRMALRAPDRPSKSKSGSKRRGRAGRAARTVSVTVSIGVAECNARLTTPAAVIGAADRALYRAKGKGHNQLSR